MSLTDDKNSKKHAHDEKGADQMHKEMETRRLALLQQLEDSKAQLESLLQAEPEQSSDKKRHSHPKPGR